MRTVLRLTVQGAWLLLGVWSAILLFTCLRVALFTRWWADFLPMGWTWIIFRICAWLIAVIVLGIFLYGSWKALFRFSFQIVSPIVLPASFVMFFEAQQGNHLFQKAYLNSDFGIEPVMPFLALALLAISFVGWIVYLRVMPGVLGRFLFPEQRPHATRLP